MDCWEVCVPLISFPKSSASRLRSLKATGYESASALFCMTTGFLAQRGNGKQRGLCFSTFYRQYFPNCCTVIDDPNSCESVSIYFLIVSA